MIEYGHKNLLFPKKLFPIHNTHNQLWFGPEFAPRVRPPWFLWIPGSKSTKITTWQKFCRGVLEPWASAHFGNRDWIFQQDSAPAHKAREVQNWCQANFPGFITSQEWPPYSPDLNPLDFSVWAILEARACAMPHKNLDSLRQALLREWAKISVQEVRAITENFPKRLRLCIKGKGGHFESSWFF